MLTSLRNTNLIVDINKYIQKLKHKYQNRFYVKDSIFIDGVKKYSNISDKVDIILSPKFYWVRKATLPVERVSQAYKIVESFFSDLLPEGDYKYKIIKEEDKFFLFAYKEEDIVDAIKQSGIHMSFVNQVFFAQTQFKDFGALDIGHDCILYVQDDILIKTPRMIFDQDVQTVSIDSVIHNIRKTMTFISIKGYDSVVESSIVQKVTFILAIIMIFYFIEYISIKKELNKIVLLQKEIKREYKIPQSTLQLQSIMKSLYKKRNKSIKSREVLNLLLKVPIKKGDILQKVAFKFIGKKKTFFMKIQLKDKKNADIYKDYLVKYFNIRNASVNNLIMTIKGDK
jgi:hypothetical protein